LIPPHHTALHSWGHVVCDFPKPSEKT